MYTVMPHSTETKLMGPVHSHVLQQSPKAIKNHQLSQAILRSPLRPPGCGTTTKPSKPETLSPKPLHPKPETLKPETLKPETLNPKPPQSSWHPLVGTQPSLIGDLPPRGDNVTEDIWSDLDFPGFPPLSLGFRPLIKEKCKRSQKPT